MRARGRRPPVRARKRRRVGVAASSSPDGDRAARAAASGHPAADDDRAGRRRTLRRLYSDLISTARTRAVAVPAVPTEADNGSGRKDGHRHRVELPHAGPDVARRPLPADLVCSAGIDSGRRQRFFGRFRRRFATSLRASLRRARSVSVIELPDNLGFPAGCNVGIERALEAGAEWVFLVNSDVVLAPDALPQLLAEARARPSAGILGPLVLSREEPDLIASAGISYSVGVRADAQPAHRASLRRPRRRRASTSPP